MHFDRTPLKENKTRKSTVDPMSSIAQLLAIAAGKDIITAENKKKAEAGNLEKYSA